MSFTALFKLSLRYTKGHPLQKALMVVGIMIGVAVIVSIDLANESINRSFQLSTESISGKATHQITGSEKGIEQRIYADLKNKMSIRKAAPVITEYVQVEELNDRTLRLLGIDPFAEPDFRNYLSSSTSFSSQETIGTLISRPGSVLINKLLSEELGASPGNQLTLKTPAGVIKVSIAGIISSQNNFTQKALSGVLITDIASAQEILAMDDRISHIDLIIPPEENTIVHKISDHLPSGVSIVKSTQRSQAVRQMSSSFELNLRAMSLLALMVGVFLIYNTITFSVVQRRAQLGTLRALGVTRQEIFFLIISETVSWGIIGTAGGLLLGVFLGTGTVRLVSQTVSDLYFLLTVNDLYIDPLILIKASFFGIFSSILSAVFPAYEASKTDPIEALRRSSLEQMITSRIPLLTFLGSLSLLGGIFVLLIPSRALWVSFSGLLLIVIAGALLVPPVTLLLMRSISSLFSENISVVTRMALRNISRSLSRTSVSIASLMIAISVIIGVGTMVSSFRVTVINWLEDTIQADLYIRPANRINIGLTVDMRNELSALPQVKAIYSISTLNLSKGRYANASIVSLDQDTANRSWIWKANSDRTMEALFIEGWIFVSEPLMWRYNLNLDTNNVVSLPTDKGEKPFQVAGVFKDFTSDQGIIVMQADTFNRHWENRKLFGISVLLKDGVDPSDVIQAIHNRVKGSQELIITSNKGLREAAVEVFDRTFTITIALQILAGLVAFIGVLNTVMSLMLERSRELGILRAGGMTMRQLWKLVLVESGLIGLLAGLFAIPLGTAMAWILVFIINKRSFGWTLDFILQFETFWQAIAISVIAALLAGIYPAYKSATASVSELLRTE